MDAAREAKAAYRDRAKEGLGGVRTECVRAQYAGHDRSRLRSTQAARPLKALPNRLGCTAGPTGGKALGSLTDYAKQTANLTHRWSHIS